MSDAVDLQLVRDVLSWILFLIGGAAVVVGALGIVRFPDFYTRLHAAGVTDTAGAELIVFGMMLQAPNWLVVAKLGLISAFLLLTSPVATHAIAQAAWISGFKPLQGSRLRYESADEDEGEGEAS